MGFYFLRKTSALNLTCGWVLFWKSHPEVAVSFIPGSLPLVLLNWRGDRFGCFYRESRWIQAEQQDCGSGAMTASKDPTKKKPKEAQQDEVHIPNTTQTCLFVLIHSWEEIHLCGQAHNLEGQCVKTMVLLLWCCCSHILWLKYCWGRVKIKNALKYIEVKATAQCNWGIFLQI